MRLKFIDTNHPHATPPERRPTYSADGSYWYAATDDGGWDGTGADPLQAVSNLAAELEREVKRRAREVTS